MEKKNWGLGDKLTAGGLFLAVIAIIVGLLTPEVRQYLHLEKSPQVAPTVASPTNQLLTPQTQSSEPPPPKPTNPPKLTKKTIQKPTTHIAGSDNIVGNTIEGSNNILGNNNTVNNYGPPPVQLMWSVNDAPAEAPTGEFAKAVTVKSNTLYAPISIVILSDADVESLSPIGASMGVQTGYLNNDRKRWFLRMAGPPLMPDSPLLVIVKSKMPVQILNVVRVVPKQP